MTLFFFLWGHLDLLSVLGPQSEDVVCPLGPGICLDDVHLLLHEELPLHLNLRLAADQVRAVGICPRHVAPLLSAQGGSPKKISEIFENILLLLIRA